MPWYKEWFGEEYLELYSHRDESEAGEHVDFVEKHLGSGGSWPEAVLDLACGAGRHTATLRRQGYRTLGLDLSLTLLARMRARGLPRVAGDMRLLPFRAGSFDWVLNFFTSFGYFERERENFRVLEEIVRVLSPGGRFLIDLMNPGPALANLKPRDAQDLDGRRVEVERRYDAGSHRINKRIVVSAPGEPPRTFFESVRIYQPEEVIIGLRWAGLEVSSLFGNFQGDPYERDSERLILIGFKPA
ncbi:MAG TPA: class I SAM-dependent methyltransferase [Thermoanaerobaculia bacterium]|jgi:SAM-dependent methyltransferase|nr:class I SAM-dependent methyltransferase [Thermoanaerobaculia bacterium]